MIISCLAVHNSLLYAASLNEINVFDLISDYSHVDTFSNDLSSSGSVKSITFHITKIFTAHQDCKIRVWQITASRQHQLVSTLPTVKDRLIRSVLPNNYVTVRRHKKRLWLEHWDAVSDLVVKQGLMYSVSWDRSFKIWNASNYKCLESVNKAHEDAVNAVAVSDNGVVYTGSADGRIRVWERLVVDHNKERKSKHMLVTTLVKHKSTVNALALNGDGSLLFSGGCDRWIVVWEREREREKDGDGDGHHQMVFAEALWGHTGAVLCLINVGDLLASGSADRTVRIWQRGKENCYRCMAFLEGHEKPVKSLVAISSSSSAFDGIVSIGSGSVNGEIKVWDVYWDNNNNFNKKNHLKWSL